MSQIDNLKGLVRDLWQVLDEEDVKLLAENLFGHEWMDALRLRTKELAAEQEGKKDDVFYQEYLKNTLANTVGNRNDEAKVILHYHLAIVQSILALEEIDDVKVRINWLVFKVVVEAIQSKIVFYLEHLDRFDENVMEELVRSSIEKMGLIKNLRNQTQEQLQKDIVKKFYEIREGDK